MTVSCHNTAILKIAVILCFLTVITAALLPTSASAQGLFSPNSGVISTCLSNPALQGKVIGKIAFCFRTSLVFATTAFVNGITLYARPAIMALLVLALAVYGSKVALWNFSTLHADTMIFLLKIAVIFGFAFNMDDWIDEIFDITDELVALVMDYVYSGLGGPLGGIGNFCPPAIDTLLGVDMRIWNALDCYTGRLAGFGAQYDFNSSVAGILLAVFTSGGVGIATGLIGIAAGLMFMYFIIKSLFYVLISYIVIAMMIVFAPLLFPLIIFKSTFKYFKAWLDSLISGMLTPVFAIAFLVFFIAVIDTIMFKGMEHGGTTYVALDQVFNTSPGQDPSENIRKIMRSNKVAFSIKFPTDPEKDADSAGLVAGMINYIKQMGADAANWLISSTLGSTEIPLGNYSELDFSAIDPAPGATDRRLRDLTYVMAALFLICYAGYSFMAQVPQMVSDMTSGSSGIVAMGVRGLFESNLIGRGARSLKGKAIKLYDIGVGSIGSMGRGGGNH